ncbi:MAG: hypothetical protein KDC71_06530 [Acidobacteria bacterium]|nr:hypothetical protein [Acidobacteriota bacterium]
MQSLLEIQFNAKQPEIERVDSTLRLTLPVPNLAGEAGESLALKNAHYEQFGPLHGFRNASGLIGCFVQKANFPLEQTVFEAYRQLLIWLGPLKLYRVWNYVPFINDEFEGLENYKSFSVGRCLAFERHYGQGFEKFLSAASAVGVEHETIAFFFVAGADEPRHVENPQQVSAFCYPAQYGPRSPSFARGTVIEALGTGYVSGTASIKGHQTLYQKDMAGQFDLTKANLELVFEQMGFGRRIPTPPEFSGYLKVYLRHPSDLAQVRALCETEFKGLACCYLKADICRADLDLEIEAVVRRL